MPFLYRHTSLMYAAYCVTAAASLLKNNLTNRCSYCVCINEIHI